MTGAGSTVFVGVGFGVGLVGFGVGFGVGVGVVGVGVGVAVLVAGAGVLVDVCVPLVGGAAASCPGRQAVTVNVSTTAATTLDARRRLVPLRVDADIPIPLVKRRTVCTP